MQTDNNSLSRVFLGAVIVAAVMLIVFLFTKIQVRENGRTPPEKGLTATIDAKRGPVKKPAYAPLPDAVITSDQVDTPLGMLSFWDGFPTDDTVQKVYDNLDFMRAVEVFLNFVPVASVRAIKKGFASVGADEPNELVLFEKLMDAHSLFLTPNTETVYCGGFLDLERYGPIVVESPPNVLGVVNDMAFRYVADLGNAGPDQGRGGKYLFVPPTHNGPIPEGYFVFHSDTFDNFIIFRGFLKNGQPDAAAKLFRQHLRIYPLAKTGNPPATRFIDASGKSFNTIHANDRTFYTELNEVIQREPAGFFGAEMEGLAASIGIVKGQAFDPDERMREILDDAAAVGNATARALVFRTRDEDAYYYAGSSWKTAFIGGSHAFFNGGHRNLDARTLFHYYATVITPAMAAKMVGQGSQYAYATTDAEGQPLDGGKTYKLNLPAEVPVQDFWSIVVYDNQTRSMLQTDQRRPSINSNQSGLQVNSDGSTDVYFGPKAPKGRENNWIQTIPGKGWNVILRLYGPLEPWFDQSWRPGEIEAMELL